MELDDVAVSRAALEHGVDASPLSGYRLRRGGRGALVLGYSGYSEHEIVEGVQALERALRTIRTTVPLPPRPGRSAHRAFLHLRVGSPRACQATG
jgi:hypothetical protein